MKLTQKPYIAVYIIDTVIVALALLAAFIVYEIIWMFFTDKSVWLAGLGAILAGMIAFMVTFCCVTPLALSRLRIPNAKQVATLSLILFALLILGLLLHVYHGFGSDSDYVERVIVTWLIIPYVYGLRQFLSKNHTFRFGLPIGAIIVISFLLLIKLWDAWPLMHSYLFG